MAFLYEVNLAVDKAATQEFKAWLTPHIEEMLSFQGFLSAHWFSRNPEDEGTPSDVTLWTVHYQLINRSAYEQYIATHAQRMRADGIKNFGGKFTATRRLLNLEHHFPTT